MPLKLRLHRHLTILSLILVFLAGCAGPTALPTATLAPATPSTTPTSSSTPSPNVVTATAQPSPTVTPAVTFTPAPTETQTPTPTPTGVPALRVPIIEYHDPDFKLNDQVQMTIPWFEDQLRWLANNGYHTLSGAELVAFLDGDTAFPQKSVVLSFDIGTAKRPIYTDSVIPALRKYNFQAVVFLLANDTVVIDQCNDARRFCWDDFKNWAKEGIFTIASHGLFHPDFTKLSTTEIKFEVETAKKLLVEKLGIDPIGFAYPFDSTSQNAMNLVKAAGYQFAVAGNNRGELAAVVNDPDRFKLPRVYPYSNTRIYPNLNGFNRPFSEVIANLTRPGPVTVAAAPMLTPTAALGSSADQLVQLCKGLPNDSFNRMNLLLKATFPTDISPEAAAALPGVSTSPSCNIFQNNRPAAIVLHYTVGELSASMFSFRQPSGTSAHYLIDRDGKVVQMVPESLGAMHVSCTGSRAVCVESCPICDDANGRLTEPYLRSIGIEIVNRGHVPPNTPVVGGLYEDFLRSYSYPYWEDYTPAQLDSLKVLVQDIAQRWNIPVDEDHVLGHYRINQKVDPGPALNLFWSRSGKPAKPPIFDNPAQP